MSAIKLFGQTIPLPLPPADKLVSDASLSEHRRCSFATSTSQDSKDESGDESTGIIDEHETLNPSEEKSTSCEMISHGKKDDESSEKPDKIIQCPRCNSMATKFCYYNNYNLNQPRHFCKNCQRYWTSGGTMRNVPVGSGRRKNRNALLPNYPHIMVPETLQADALLISSPGFPISFYPATLYWAPSPPATSSGSVLGKHSRETLRSHDPSEAAKSCKWSTLGIKNETVGLFKAFESKGDRRSKVDNRAMVVQANPAALCRSLNLHEST